MKEIEAWAVVHKDGKLIETETSEEQAKITAKYYDGTVVRLTGKMPRELRKVSTEVWIEPCEPDMQSSMLLYRLGFKAWNSTEKYECHTRARITREELEDEE